MYGAKCFQYSKTAVDSDLLELLEDLFALTLSEVTNLEN